MMKFMKSLICIVSFFLLPLYAYEYELAICAIFQNEARFLKEWIEFHKLMGVQHFYLYNNLSTDHYLKVLQPYLATGEVELIEHSLQSANQIEFNTIQIGAYDHALNLARGHAKWVAFIDTDEFLFPCQSNNLVEFLKVYEAYAGLSVNWQVFGTSSVKKIAHNQLMIEALLWKGNQDLEINYNTKSIVQPHLVKHCTGAHNFAFHEPYYAVYSNFALASPYPTSPYLLTEDIRINHYWTRDEKFFFDVKMPRYQLWHQKLDFLNELALKLNEIQDTKILKWKVKLRKKMKFKKKITYNYISPIFL